MPYLDQAGNMGFRSGDTSLSAAVSMQTPAATYRAHVLRTLKNYGPMTADEIAEKLGASILTIRPRVSELKNDGRIIDTGERGVNASGRSSIIWKIED